MFENKWCGCLELVKNNGHKDLCIIQLLVMNNMASWHPWNAHKNEPIIPALPLQGDLKVISVICLFSGL